MNNTSMKYFLLSLFFALWILVLLVSCNNKSAGQEGRDSFVYLDCADSSMNWIRVKEGQSVLEAVKEFDSKYGSNLIKCYEYSSSLRIDTARLVVKTGRAMAAGVYLQAIDDTAQLFPIFKNAPHYYRFSSKTDVTYYDVMIDNALTIDAGGNMVIADSLQAIRTLLWYLKTEINKDNK